MPIAAGAKCDAHALGTGTGSGHGPPQSGAPCGSPLERQSQSTEGKQAEAQRVRAVCASHFCLHACRSPWHVSATFQRVTCCSCYSLPASLPRLALYNHYVKKHRLLQLKNLLCTNFLKNCPAATLAIFACMHHYTLVFWLLACPLATKMFQFQ